MAFIKEDNVDELVQAQTLVWKESFLYIKSMCLKGAIDLGIPDVINHHGKPISLQELALALQLHPTKTQHLYRFMRILIHSGLFKLQNIEHSSQEGYVLTPASRLLLKDNPLNMSSLVFLSLDKGLTEPYNHLVQFLKNDDETPFFTVFQDTLYGYSGSDANFGALMKDGFASDSMLISKVVVNKCKNVFDGLNSLIDVGGGIGIMAKTIAEAFPNITCTVLDLPYAVAGLKDTKNLKYVSGDMFKEIPPADAIFLKWVMHDWNDEACVKVLKNCKKSILANGRGGKVIIADAVHGYKTPDEDSVELQLFFDITVMICEPGRQKTEKEFAKVFSDAGFSNYKIHPVLGPRALIEVFP